MDHSLLSWTEKHYRIIVFFILLFASLALPAWCTLKSFDSQTVFYASALYAFILFAIGAYTNHIASKTNEQFTERANFYYQLTTYLKRAKLTNKFYKKKFIVDFYQEATGRTKNDLERREKNGDEMFFDSFRQYPKIPLLKKTEETLESLESQFSDLNSSICESTKSIILDYANENSLTIDQTIINDIDDALTFSLDKWSRSTLGLNTCKKICLYFTSHSLYSELEKKSASLHHVFTKLSQQYVKFEQTAARNISTMDRIYGKKRISYEIDRLFSIEQDVYDLKNEISESIEGISDKIDEVYSFIQSCQDSIDSIDQNIESIHEELEELHEINDKLDKPNN